jgi:hypothetical protein
MMATSILRAVLIPMCPPVRLVVVVELGLGPASLRLAVALPPLGL